MPRESTFSALTTSRLTLRALVPADAAALYAYRSHPDVARYQAWDVRDEGEVHAFIAGLQELALGTPGTWYQIGITLREGDTLIGDCGLHFDEQTNQQVEVGITLAPAYQGQGYATEALQAVLSYLLSDFGAHRVFARVDPQNQASIALLERVGMRQEGHLRESTWVHGAWADDLIYALLAQEWRFQQQARVSLRDKAHGG